MTLRLTGGQVLQDEGLVDADLLLQDGTIAGLGATTPSARTFDATGLLVLPGIVDLHGDAFERQIQPRPGVGFPQGLALRDTQAQLLSSGITTAFLAATLSWEPGLRSPQAWRALLDARAAQDWTCDIRIHMRWELHNLGSLDMAVADIEAGDVGLVSFNDHTPEIVRKLETVAGAAKYSERSMTGIDAFRALAHAALARTPEVAQATARIAAAARAAGLAMASHDDDVVERRASFRELGAHICEFPMAEPVAQDARAAGEAVVMGCPNVVRGGSHLGWTSAAELTERGLCTVLCSDYFYPAMPAAALRLAHGPVGLVGAWSLVSRNPARAANLPDRGWIMPGTRADIVLVDPATSAIAATIVRGQVVHLGAGAWQRLA